MVKIKKREVKHFVQEQRRPKLNHMCKRQEKKEGDREQQKVATHKQISPVMKPRSQRNSSYATMFGLGVHWWSGHVSYYCPNWGSTKRSDLLFLLSLSKIYSKRQLEEKCVVTRKLSLVQVLSLEAKTWPHHQNMHTSWDNDETNSDWS